MKYSHSLSYSAVASGLALGARNQRTNTFYAGNGGIVSAVYAMIDGDTILVNPGVYNVFASGSIYCQFHTILKSSVPGSKFVLDMQNVHYPIVVPADGKNLTMEDFELRFNLVLYGNYGGVHGQASPQTIILRRGYLHDCSNGIKIGQCTGTTLLVEDCEILNCGSGDTQAHNLYVDNIASLTVRGLWSHMSRADGDPGVNNALVSWGHLLKSRARVNVIEGCRLTMEHASANRCIDLPNGGDCTIRGCLIELNAHNINSYSQASGVTQTTLMTFGVEEGDNFSAHHPVNRLNFQQNTIVNHLQPPNALIQVFKLNPYLDNGFTCSYKDNVFAGFAKVPTVSGFTPSYIWQCHGGVTGAENTTPAYEISETDNTFLPYSTLGTTMPNHATFDFTMATPVVGSQNWAQWAYSHPSQHVPRTDNLRGGVSGVSSVGWGAGANAGTLVGDLWTPGRDANGVVNLASWNTVPLNRWIEVAGTRLDGLQAAITAAVPGWVDRGNSDWDGVTDAWNGMAFDVRVGFERGWFACAGGHADSSNDGIYKLDMRKMGWAIERLPTDTTWWDPAYTSSWGGGFKAYPPAMTYYNANNSNAEGVFWDEFFTPGDPAHSPRTPTARHMYGSLAFAPNLGTQGKLITGCLRYWEYDLASKAWALPKFPFGNAAGYDGSKGYAGENMHGWWDEVQSRYYVCATQNYDAGVTWSCAPGGVSFTNNGWYPTGGYRSQFCAIEKVGRTLWCLIYDLYDNAHGKPYEMIKTNLDTAHIDPPIRITLGASFSGVGFDANTFWDGQGMTYVADNNSFFCNVYTTAGMKWCWINAATWVAELATLPGNIPSYDNATIEKKVQHFPSMHALAHVYKGTQNIRIIRFA